tara:strand:- start:589 stop:846 length:258 start_codon:yes stop_codon:yes gene_type:complete
MENEEIRHGTVEIHQDRPESYIPKNIINTPHLQEQIDIQQKYNDLKKDNERLRENNTNYKLQLIAVKEKLYKITKIIEQENGTTF